MSDNTFHITKEDVKKLQAQESARHGGNIPADSEAAGLQSILDSADKNKDELIAERQANLPLPDQPQRASDFNSADARTVNVGSGGTAGSLSYGDDALRGPATADSAYRTDGSALGTHTAGTGVGREAAEGLSGLPNDAVAGSKKNAAGLAETTNKDYGYPQKSDPADTSKLP